MIGSLEAVGTPRCQSTGVVDAIASVWLMIDASVLSMITASLLQCPIQQQ